MRVFRTVIIRATENFWSPCITNTEHLVGKWTEYINFILQYEDGWNNANKHAINFSTCSVNPHTTLVSQESRSHSLRIQTTSDTRKYSDCICVKIYTWKPTNASIIIQFISYVRWLLHIWALYCHPQGAILEPSERCSIEVQSIKYYRWVCRVWWRGAWWLVGYAAQCVWQDCIILTLVHNFCHLKPPFQPRT
jgi:hypothetical protein